jgi:hypothetical protein
MTDASELMDKRIAELGHWRGEALGELRRTIREADPDIVEEWKWVKPTNPGVPVWSHNGGICTGDTYKSVVKLTFYKGASLSDPAGLFNSSLDGKVRRAIDIREGEKIDKGTEEPRPRSRSAQPEEVMQFLCNLGAVAPRNSAASAGQRAARKRTVEAPSP